MTPASGRVLTDHSCEHRPTSPGNVSVGGSKRDPAGVFPIILALSLRASHVCVHGTPIHLLQRHGRGIRMRRHRSGQRHNGLETSAPGCFAGPP